MKYKINEQLVYDVADGTLTILGHDEPDTQLSITANALLYVLIKNPGIMLRDDVLKIVWDDNGLVSSNGNLNQYICMLRKTFRYYGIDNVIVTIPKGRLEINPDLMIELVDSLVLLPLETHATEATSVDVNANDTPSVYLRSRYDAYWQVGSVVMFICAFVIFAASLFTGDEIQVSDLTPVTHSECDLLATKATYNSGNEQDFVRSFSAVKKKLTLRCSDDERFVFFYGDELQTNGLGRTFLARCAKSETNDFHYCDNYFYYSWK